MNIFDMTKQFTSLSKTLMALLALEGFQTQMYSCYVTFQSESQAIAFFTDVTLERFEIFMFDLKMFLHG